MIRPKTRSSGSCLPNLGKDEISSLLGSHFLPSFPCPWPGACTRSGFVCLFWLKSHHTHSPCMGLLQKCPFPLPPGSALVGEHPECYLMWGHNWATVPLLFSCRCVALLQLHQLPSLSAGAHMYMHHAFTHI